MEQTSWKILAELSLEDVSCNLPLLALLRFRPWFENTPTTTAWVKTECFYFCSRLNNFEQAITLQQHQAWDMGLQRPIFPFWEQMHLSLRHKPPPPCIISSPR